MTSSVAFLTCGFFPLTFRLRAANWFLGSLVASPEYCAWSDSVVKSGDEFELAEEEIAAVNMGVGTGVGGKAWSLGTADRSRPLPRANCSIILKSFLFLWSVSGGGLLRFGL